jgi:hypothetical protein
LRRRRHEQIWCKSAKPEEPESKLVKQSNMLLTKMRVRARTHTRQAQT